jgi:hypothetical protein
LQQVLKGRMADLTVLMERVEHFHRN